ncbi:MAG TPA: cation transporter [Phycisphaerales bacterium]|nr:cation transporter [Phycisphaerales bacterium]HRQ76930.1 cation transporter [Phycisphaerales bacterium]
MKATYDIEGMHCGRCAAKVAGALRSVEGIRNADVSIDTRRATIEADAPVDLDRVRRAVEAVGDYHLLPASSPDSHAGTHAEHATTESVDGSQPSESLYPLVLIVGYILGVVILIALATGNWAAEPMMRHFMAGFFIVFSFFKMLDLPGFVTAYRDYDIPARAFPAWAWAYPFVELGLGIAYLLALAPIATNVITLVVMLVGAIGVLKALLDKKRIRCACLGTALNLPMTKVTLIEDLTMAAMAGAMLLTVA